MNNRYDRCIRKWDTVFSTEAVSVPETPTSGNESLDKALVTLCKNSENVLDFGCGNGTLLFLCALLGTKRHIGIDLCECAIRSAKRRSEVMPSGEFSFIYGGVEQLKSIQTASIDAVVLSNIVDNLFPGDALFVLSECKRVLKPDGKALIKLNPYLSKQQITDWGISVIEGNMLDDGLLLWNNSTDEWTDILGQFFRIVRFENIHYAEHDQTNRLFLLKNKQNII